MKKIFLLLIFGGCLVNAYSQNISASVITDSIYLSNPRAYLSQINTSNVTTGVLIDRDLYPPLVLNMNGFDKVTTISSSEWNAIYKNISRSVYDSLVMPNLDTISYFSDLIYNNEKCFPIGIIDYHFNRIKQSAIDNQEFILGSLYLQDNGASINSFSVERVVAISSLQNTIYGDKVNFLFSKFFYYNNHAEDSLISIEMDFGNQAGFIPVQFNDQKRVVVQYSQPSGYIELIGKLTYINKITGNESIVYSHSTVYRIGSNSVPLPDNAPAAMKSMNDLIQPDTTCMFPTPIWEWVTEGVGMPPYDFELSYWRQVNTSRIEFNILYSPQNSAHKQLRRPFIICEGFDPGNKRDYFLKKVSDDTDTALWRDYDRRGLFSLLNGDPSPWYNEKPKINLIDKLREDGYDLVFINFMDGTGDININAGVTGLRGFIRDLLNGPQYRDEKTEEAILVGASMGGIITRHALTSMEQAGEEHFVKMWFSFDAPQAGAYIPLGLQHAINYLGDFPCYGIGRLQDARDQFREGRKIVNTLAAKHMLIYHYGSTDTEGKPDLAQKMLYNSLDTSGVNHDGYPIYSKNFAISNGGKSKLYENNQQKILDIKVNEKLGWLAAICWTCYLAKPYWFEAKAWGNNNTFNSSSSDIFSGSYSAIGAGDSRATNYQLGFENAPGGWNALLYSLNCSPQNAHHTDNDQDIVRTRATFMVTASAFGIPVTKDNVYLDWTKYTNCNDNTSGLIKTKFDAIRGQKQNEEHVTISDSTGNYLQAQLEADFALSQRPRIRDGNAINQQVKGLVAYTAKDNLKFGGNNNTFAFENGAKSRITAGNTIQWLPGFSANAGSNISAKIQTIEYSTVLKSSRVNEPLFDYKPSAYAWQKHDYSSKNNTNEIIESSGLTLFPNPACDRITITYANQLHSQAIISVYNTKGQLVHKAISNDESRYMLDVRSLPNGIYSVNVVFGNNSATLKFIKQ